MRKERKDIFLGFGNDIYSIKNFNKITYEHGIYLAYSGHYDRNKGYVVTDKLLYIGKADKDTFTERIADHINNDHAEWQTHCEYGDIIYYQVAELSHDISDVEAAMIFAYQPPCNTQGKDRYMGNIPTPNVETLLSLPQINGVEIDRILDKNNED